MGSTHAETSQTHNLNNDKPFYYISEADLQKLLYLDRPTHQQVKFRSKTLPTAF